VSELIYDGSHDILGVTPKLTRSGSPTSAEWGRRALVMDTRLLETNCPASYEDWQRFKWADQMGLFAWALAQLSDTDSLPFVLHYWDWHPKNAIVNDRDELR
jgi:hypothetical protein